MRAHERRTGDRSPLGARVHGGRTTSAPRDAPVVLALQRAAGNRAVGHLLSVQRLVPPTKVTWTPETRTDPNVPAALVGKVPTTFTLGSRMEADPLSSDPGGYVGSPPKGKSDWWPYLQERHKLGGGLHWVQGHLLNDNVHGPGEPDNLTPLSGPSNTNMETNGERAVKEAVLTHDKVVHYVVWADWTRTPAEMHKDFGLVADGTGSLLWGEQFAPAGISWQAWEKVETPPGSGIWVDGPPISQPAPSWYNTFPVLSSPSVPEMPPVGFAMTVAPQKVAGGCTITIKGTGFTDHGKVRIGFFGIPRTGEVVGSRAPEVVQPSPTVTGGTFTTDVAFPHTSVDVAHKALNVQVSVKDEATSHTLHQLVSAGYWVA